MIRRLILPLALTCAGVFSVAAAGTGSASASAVRPASTGTTTYTTEQAGYAATGANFKVGEYRVTLPNPAKYAKILGRIGFSVQLWSAGQVDDLLVYACTDATCAAGGSGAASRYRLVFSVYNPTTHALVCTTTNNSCPSVPAAWNSTHLTTGQVANLSLAYPATANSTLSAAVNQLTYSGYKPDTGGGVISFSQARLSTDFGASPWAAPSWRAPSARTELVSLGVPAGPPYEAELVTYSGSSGCLGASHWTIHKVEMTHSGGSGSPVEITPESLSNAGCDFSLYAER